MSLLFVSGDLFCTPNLDAYAHGVNLSGAMGAGIALQMKRKFWSMHHVYLEECHRGLHKLGSVMRWDTNTPLPGKAGQPEYIFNLFTQQYPGPCADLYAVGDALYECMRQCQHLDVTTLGLPLIGTGLGGLETEPVKEFYQYVANKFPEVDMVAFETYKQGEAAKW